MFPILITIGFILSAIIIMCVVGVYVIILMSVARKVKPSKHEWAVCCVLFLVSVAALGLLYVVKGQLPQGQVLTFSTIKEMQWGK